MSFETNLDNNALHKVLTYFLLLTDLAKDYNKSKFVNLRICCLGIFGSPSDSFPQMCNERGIKNRDYIFTNMVTISEL